VTCAYFNGIGAKAAQICGLAAKQLTAKLQHEKDPNSRNSLAQALAALASRLDPVEAKRTCDGVIRLALRARSEEQHDRNDRNALDGIVLMLLPYLDSETASIGARDLSAIIFAEADVNIAQPMVGGGAWMGGVDHPLDAVLESVPKASSGRFRPMSLEPETLAD
jgi:hypothetical protein